MPVTRQRHASATAAKKMHTCHIHVRGKPCGKQSRDAYNHKRHLVRKHGLTAAAVRPLGGVHLTAADFQHAGGRCPSGEIAPGSVVAATRVTDAGSSSQPGEGWRLLGAGPERSAAQSPSMASPAMSTAVEAGGEQRRWLSDAREPVPSYQVKRSRAYRHQQCALSWLSEEGVRHFGRHIRALLGSWGISDPDYKDSCVLVPAAWGPLRPVDILPLFNRDRCPERRGDRLVSSCPPLQERSLIPPSATSFTTTRPHSLALSPGLASTPGPGWSSTTS